MEEHTGSEQSIEKLCFSLLTIHETFMFCGCTVTFAMYHLGNMISSTTERSITEHGLFYLACEAVYRNVFKST